ncbi:MAG: sodium:calcium antiporter [Vicinamibacterales bacterium]
MTAPQIVLLFVTCAAVIVYTGTRLSFYGDAIADRSGLGQAWIGVAAMASVTSLPELVTGASSVLYVGAPDIAIGDVIGSCLFNLLLLAGLDLASPRPLFGRVRSAHTLTAAFGALLLAFVAIAVAGAGRLPAIGWFGSSSLVLFGGYFVAVRAVFLHERKTGADLLADEPVEPRHPHLDLRTAVTWYVVNAAVLVVAAISLPALAAALAALAGLSHGFVGTTLVALSTSLPEVVVSMAAARIGAWDLAVANVLGSNLFNVAILAVDDVLYRRPLLADADPTHVVTATAAAAMSSLVVCGLVYRHQTRMGRVSWISVALVVVYGVALALAAH